MIQELINSTKVALYERTASPLFGAFLVSWCFWNWEVLLVLFSQIPVLNKISFVDSYFSGFLRATWLLLIGPGITSLFYLFIYPIPAKYVYQYTQCQQRDLKSIRVKIEDETPLTLEESRQLRVKLSELEGSFYSQLASKDAEINKLRTQSSQKAEKPVINDVSTNKNVNYNKPQPNVSDLNEESISTPVITDFTVAGNTYRLGEDFYNSAPGETNVIQLKDKFSYRDTISVSFTIDKPLQQGQRIMVFDGHDSRLLDGNTFEINKIDYENRSAFIVVEQDNPQRERTKMRVSNLVQFEY
ncbi:hypothetical protein ACFJ92_004522 [Vibrio parahaemolyticus]|nr:hypothetical protein [Vibrio parahaemolyticus]ELR9975076.1 hypothetical protein [Vibrio parahaemolyticus]MBE3740184.1 hypothetical protein [Vibrio parahaemolyticus]HBC3388668.1 hypothetical protein [Vibrio parahaemolyticus]HCG8153887.1 hypothetical protein [Vibrio parahaemolyticus]